MLVLKNRLHFLHLQQPTGVKLSISSWSCNTAALRLEKISVYCCCAELLFACLTVLNNISTDHFYLIQCDTFLSTRFWHWTAICGQRLVKFAILHKYAAKIGWLIRHLQFMSHLSLYNIHLLKYNRTTLFFFWSFFVWQSFFVKVFVEQERVIIEQHSTGEYTLKDQAWSHLIWTAIVQDVTTVKRTSVSMQLQEWRELIVSEAHMGWW